MRISPKLIAVVLCAASSLAAHAQLTTSNPVKGPAKLPGGMSFAFDAERGSINATGVQLQPSMKKSESAVAPTTGTLVVTVKINAVSHFEAGTVYRCSVYAIGGIIDVNNGAIDGGVETANNFAVGSGSARSCTLRIPYSWTLPADAGAEAGLILAFGVGALNVHGEVEHSTLQVDGIENLPASGVTSHFTFDVAL